MDENSFPCSECGTTGRIQTDEFGELGYECPTCEGLGRIPREKFTCFNCGYSKECFVAWDEYNLNGDCLSK